MADIFGYKRSPKADGVFSSEDSSMTIGALTPSSGASRTSPAYMIQNWNVEYTQDVQEIFEIGSNRLYWAKGRPIGRGSIGRIVGGGGGGAGLFSSDAYDICNGGVQMSIKATGGHCDAPPVGGGVRFNNGVNLEMDGVVVTSIGYAMNVADVRIMENYGWRFAHMKVISDVH